MMKYFGNFRDITELWTVDNSLMKAIIPILKCLMLSSILGSFFVFEHWIENTR